MCAFAVTPICSKSVTLHLGRVGRGASMIVTKKNFSCVLFSILPVKMAVLTADYMGAFNVMDSFVGKNKKN